MNSVFARVSRTLVLFAISSLLLFLDRSSRRLTRLTACPETLQLSHFEPSDDSTTARRPQLSRTLPEHLDSNFALSFLLHLDGIPLTSRAQPLFFALSWTHRHIMGNSGWSILALTLCVNLALMPMRIRAMQPQLKLQRLQPEIAPIEARFRRCKLGDPRMQEMNHEIFAAFEIATR